MSDLRMGIYRHYKGPLYQVIGLAHDANADGGDELSATLDGYDYVPLTERIVVVYMPLQLDGAHLGPRMCVRTLEDFTATVHTADGTVSAGEACSRLVGKNVADRFTYLGPVLTADML